MKKNLLLAAFFISSFASFAQDKYDAQWRNIDSLIVVSSLPKTALDKVNKLYVLAKQQKDPVNVLKALLYQLFLLDKTSDIDINQQLNIFKKELSTTGDTLSKSVLNAILANEIYTYYARNVWRISQRKETVDFKDSDITTWSNPQLIQTTDSFYNEALSCKNVLQKTGIAYLDAIIVKGNVPNRRPTLYDLIAHEALNYFKTGMAYITQPTYAFKLSDAQLLSDAGSFMQHSFTSPDTASHLLKAVRLFQQLLRFHSADKDPAAFIDVDIERLQWMRDHADVSHKDELYKTALLTITQHFPASKATGEAWYALAGIESDKAASYQAYGSDANRYGYVKAKQLIDERLAAMPDSSFGSYQMRSLLQKILQPEITIQVEAINVPGAPFRLLVQYKNTDTLYARLLLQKDVDKAEKKKDWNEWRDIGSLLPVKTFQQALPRTNDYQSHSVEIKADALSPGDYVLLFSNSKDFRDTKDKLGTQSFTVSGIAYLRSDENYFVVNRETGQPIPNVKVTGTIGMENTKNDKVVTKKIKPLYTDSAGHFSLPVNHRKYTGHDVNVTFEKGDDILQSGDYLQSYRYSRSNDDENEDDSDYEDDNSHVYFFTDRSIYRSGQTVCYKGIATTKDRKTKQSKLYHITDSVEVDLYDANAKLIDSQFVRLNEYGSFSGKFFLPQNVLTGEFSIKTVEFNAGEASFNVEEYKRPTFYIAFDSLKTSYRLNDTIVLTGSAKAYAGSVVDNAKITYSISRAASFPYSYLFWKRAAPYSREAEIADSIININADGSFNIRFAATPDSSVDAATQPLFNYKVDLSITDANGETREANTEIQVAYQSVVLRLNTPKIADAHSFKNIFITTKNNAGVSIPAKVNIKISPLKTPAKDYRKRLWSQPDQYLMSREEFASYFPDDEYKSETDYHEWNKKKPILLDTFNTALTSDYKLPVSMLPQGWYCIEATTKGKDGNEVKDVCYVQLYNKDAPGLPAPQTNFSYVINSSGAPGEKAQLLLGSTEKNVFVVTQMKQGESQSEDSFGYVRLDSNKQEVDYTIQSTDKGTIGLYYSFIKHNRFYTGGMQISVSRENKELKISYATYRNKTEPGSKETWTVQVHDSAGKHAAAELLTSMYDASLDQFKNQQWDLPYVSSYSYVSNDWQGGDFTSKSSFGNYLPHMPYRDKRYDYIASSAGELLRLYDKEYKMVPRGRLSTGRIASTSYFEGDIVADSLVARYDLEGKASGIQVQHMKIPLADEDMNPEMRYNLRGRSSLSEVVVTGYGTARKKDLTGAISVVNNKSLSDTSFMNVMLRGLIGTNNLQGILIILDGVVTNKKIEDLDINTIDHIDVLKGSEATALYGAKAANGAIVVTTKDFALLNRKKQPEPPQVQIRKNFNETAFFFPQLHADTSGNYSFSFTMPDAVTQWKWMSFAHTKQLDFGYREQSVISQKTLMVQPNLPRFLREGDSIAITAKISNLSDVSIKGTAMMQLLDAITSQPLNDSFRVMNASQIFLVEADKSQTVTFPVAVPLSYIHPLIVRVIAASDRYSDGEEKMLPVLSNRTLVTETLPLYMQGSGTKHFVFDKLADTHSSTLTSESLTVEYTANPVWYVVQSLPYLMQFPHECAEQTFNRFYANVLAGYIVARHPQIRQVFNEWRKDSGAFKSNLEVNPELKSMFLNETPWVTDAESETQQKKNLANLFDTMKVSHGAAFALQQLAEMQMDNGAFAWFKGGEADRYITQYILAGIGKLNHLHAVSPEEKEVLGNIVSKALSYLDKEEENDYKELIKSKEDLVENHLSAIEIQYWYMRSFFMDEKKSIPAKPFAFFIQQADDYWTKQSSYMQGMIAIALHRLQTGAATTTTRNVSLAILRSLTENAVVDTAKGMYWKNNTDGYYWYQSPTEAQALLVDAYKEIIPADSSLSAMSRWLLLNKQINHWSTTKATADACFALLYNNDSLLSQARDVSVRAGDSVMQTTDEKAQAGSGYFRHRIDGKNVRPSMGNITVSVSQPHADKSVSTSSYGTVYWQYFEQMDKITSASSPVSVSRKLFVEKNSDKGKVLQSVTDTSTLKTGDKIIVRLVVKSDRDMDYIQLTDMRASSMEPVHVLSGYQWQDGTGFYESTKDVATNFFFSHLAKGTYVFDYPVYLTHSGNCLSGMATIQCMYAPAFAAHSEGIRIEVKNQDK